MNLHWNDYLGIIAAIIAIFGALAFPVKGKFWIKINLWFGRKKIEYYSSSKKIKTFYFPQKISKLRVTVGALASISNSKGEYLCNFAERDKRWKPIGGALKLSDVQKNIIKNYDKDDSTKFKGKENDFRIFINNKLNTSVITKALKSYGVDGIKKELMREVEEELGKSVPLSKIKLVHIECNFIKEEVSPINYNELNIQFIFEVLLSEKIKPTQNIDYISIEEFNKDPKKIANTITYLNKNTISNDKF